VFLFPKAVFLFMKGIGDFAGDSTVSGCSARALGIQPLVQPCVVAR